MTGDGIMMGDVRSRADAALLGGDATASMK
jgi:hypothetical protein